MDNKNLVGIVGSIHFETELLEALDWDEEKLKDVTKKLSEYFAVCSKSDLDLIKVDLGFIFSEEIGNIVSLDNVSGLASVTVPIPTSNSATPGRVIA